MSKSVSAAQAEQAAAKRKRTMTIAGIVLAVLVAAGVAIALAGGSDKKESPSSASSLSGVAETKALFKGIPQTGNILGDPDAKVTLIEFVDLQCPFCKQFATGAFPEVVNKYVRTGKVKLQLETLAFLGPDSLKAARAAAGASQQNKLFDFTELFYRNQGQENSGYVTDKFIDALYDGSGVDKAKANAFRRTAASKEPITEATSLGEKYGVISTPTFVAGPTDGKKDIIEVSNTDASSFAVLEQMAQ